MYCTVDCIQSWHSSVGLFFLFSGPSVVENNRETNCGGETPFNQEKIGDVQGENLREQH